MGILKIQLQFLLFFIPAFTYWFILGPDIRFIQGYFIGLTFVVALPFLFYLGSYFQEGSIVEIFNILLITFLLYFILINRNELLWIVKKGNQDKWPFIPQNELTYVVSPQKIKIYYPKTGDQCMDVNSLCSNEKKNKLNVTVRNGRYIFTEK